MATHRAVQVPGQRPKGFTVRVPALHKSGDNDPPFGVYSLRALVLFVRFQYPQ